MLRFLRRHMETVIVAFVVAAVTAGAPAIAAVVQHARYADQAGVSRNARHLGGILPGGFYRTGSTVANSNMLDGQDSSAFLPRAGKAVDADKLDGHDSTEFALAGAGGDVAKGWVLVDNNTPSVVKSIPTGWAVAKAPAAAGPGVYCLTPPAGSSFDPTKEAGVATVENSLSEDRGLSLFVEIDVKPTAPTPAGPGCAAGQFAIRTFKAQTGGPTSSDVFAVPDANVAFFFLVT